MSDNQITNTRMPTQPHERQILRKRAISLANRQQVDDQQNTELFLHFHLHNGEHYGIPYQYLDEILRPKPITPIPDTADIIVGVIPYHGELMTVLDLSQMLKIVRQTDQEEIKKSWLVIVSVEQLNVALLVKEVRGNYSYRPQALFQSLDSTQKAQNDPISGIFNNKIAILDLSILLNSYHLTSQENK